MARTRAGIEMSQVHDIKQESAARVTEWRCNFLQKNGAGTKSVEIRAHRALNQMSRQRFRMRTT